MTVLSNKQINSLEDLERVREELRKKRKSSSKSVCICMGPGCVASGHNVILDAGWVDQTIVGQGDSLLRFVKRYVLWNLGLLARGGVLV